MASKADRCAISIISTVHGSIRLLIKEKRFSRLDIRERLIKMNKYCSEMRDKWCSNYNEKDIQITLKQMNRWGEIFDGLKLRGDLQTTVLVKIALMSLNDLYAKLSDQRKINLLLPLVRELEFLDDFIDSLGTAFLSMDQANLILEKLYNEIGFEP